MDRQYIAIDLKSFYASVECRERGLDPLTTNLVVADSSRTEKTICLAVSPSLKEYGIPGRARLYQVIETIKKVNAKRRYNIHNKDFIGSSYNSLELKANPELELSYIVAPPRMAYYIKYSTDIYKIYLKYVSPDDIHVYSIDEVFIDVTKYLDTYKSTPHELAMHIIQDVLKNTGITATAGIGTNLYLAKIAMDIMAKHTKADKGGVRIAELDEMSYRRLLWSHTPITDFWRVGSGTSKRLSEIGIYTMGDIARCSVGKKNEFYNDELLYKMFGVNAELLIDHAWGWEPCTIADIKKYKPTTNSLSSGQVLHCPYDFEKAKLVLKEMTDTLMLDIVGKDLVTDQLVLDIGYDTENLNTNQKMKSYKGVITTDRYGRKVPKQAHGTANLGEHTSSIKKAMEEVIKLFDKIVDKNMLIRRLTITANHVIYECDIKPKQSFKQLDFFTDYEAEEHAEKELELQKKREKDKQKAILDIKNKFGKNAIVKGMNLLDGATAMSRNRQIGGHKA